MDKKMKNKTHEWLYIMIWVLGVILETCSSPITTNSADVRQPTFSILLNQRSIFSGFYKQSCLNISLNDQVVLWILYDSFLKELTVNFF